MPGSEYTVTNVDAILSPGMVLFQDILDANLAEMIHIAGDASRLRPHCKTHKMAEVVQRELDKGIVKHKAATFAEAEMLADTGVKDILYAYQPVGPNIGRAATFLKTYPDVTFIATVDDAGIIRTLGEAMTAAGVELPVLLDVDTGQHRTGVLPDDKAVELYRLIASTRGVRPAGFHVYDGHQHQLTMAEREAAINPEWEKVMTLRSRLLEDGLSVERIVAGGTGSFPVYAAKDVPGLELSPGTCVFQDVSYGEQFPDLKFRPAALLCTRVVSRPTPARITCDLGYKAVASDPPMDKRVFFPDLPNAKLVLQNEEHLVLQMPEPSDIAVGTVLWAVPRHVCPTSALHKSVTVVADGEIVGCWNVIARDRSLTI